MENTRAMAFLVLSCSSSAVLDSTAAMSRRNGKAVRKMKTKPLNFVAMKQN
jgi:hypothetical protein